MRNPSMVFAPVVVTVGVNSRTVPVQGLHMNIKHSLPAAVMDKIKPVFRDLAGVDPLRKCFHGKTHNPNEHVNSVIGTRISKTVFVMFDTLRFGVYDAVLGHSIKNQHTL
jgi:hypothetical protein